MYRLDVSVEALIFVRKVRCFHRSEITWIVLGRILLLGLTLIKLIVPMPFEILSFKRRSPLRSLG